MIGADKDGYALEQDHEGLASSTGCHHAFPRFFCRHTHPAHLFNPVCLAAERRVMERAAVTFFSWAALGYSFKFVWAPLIDRMPLPWLTRRLGRRRGLDGCLPGDDYGCHFLDGSASILPFRKLT